jgi:hypothetical protein
LELHLREAKECRDGSAFANPDVYEFLEGERIKYAIRLPANRILQERIGHLLTTLKEKLIKIGAKVVRHGRYVAFQMAEVAIPRNLFANILQMIAQLRPPPDPAPA